MPVSSLRILRTPLLLLLGVLLFMPSALAQSQTPSETKSQVQNQYTLSPQKYQKAIAYARARYALYFSDTAYGFLVLFLILEWRWSAKFRDLAERASEVRLLQSAIFIVLLVLTIAAFELPAEMYAHRLALKYNQSVQHWPSWFADWGKGLLLEFVLATFLVWIFYAIVRRRPRRWWFYSWLVAIPFVIFIAFIEPVVVEPMFFKFVPLQQNHPELVIEIERIVNGAGMNIPPGRMFEMKASAKWNSLNAYVTGVGASKRVVVWDTTMQKMTVPEVLFVFGHEMGHYVLHHVAKGILLTISSMLIALFLAFHLFRWSLQRYGARWHLGGQDDWASLPLLLLIFTLIGFFATPIASAISRNFEHEADIYGLEVTHVVNPDWRVAATHSFQILGEVSLDDPNPSPFIKFWLYDHPSIDDRIHFAAGYDPWSKGERPEFVK